MLELEEEFGGSDGQRKGILIEHRRAESFAFCVIQTVNESNYREQFDPVVARRRLPSGVCR